LTDKQGYVRVHTEGGKIEYRCGIVLCSTGIHFGHGHPDNVSSIIQSVKDSNVAEAKAVLKALDIASKQHQKKVKIYTDSDNTIKIINSVKAKAIYRLRQER